MRFCTRRCNVTVRCTCDSQIFYAMSVSNICQIQAIVTHLYAIRMSNRRSSHASMRCACQNICDQHTPLGNARAKIYAIMTRLYAMRVPKYMRSSHASMRCACQNICDHHTPLGDARAKIYAIITRLYAMRVPKYMRSSHASRRCACQNISDHHTPLCNARAKMRACQMYSILTRLYADAHACQI